LRLSRPRLPLPDGPVDQDVAVRAPLLDPAALELLLVQRCVQTTPAQQIAVRAGFHDTSPVDDVDNVGVDDGGQAMGDGDGGRGDRDRASGPVSEEMDVPERHPAAGPAPFQIMYVSS
jgi:hypothetical protein